MSFFSAPYGADPQKGRVLRFTSLDLGGSLKSRWKRALVRVSFGVTCAVAMILLRAVFNMWAPTSGPFALVYPTVLIATLYGRWHAGVVSYIIAFAWAWWLVLPQAYSFRFIVPTDPSRVAINAFAAMIVVLLAEAWRRAVREAVSARDQEIDRRDVLMAELEHRTKNNFALVASLLSLQKRRLDDAAASSALDEAIGRVHSFASAYANLAATHGEGVQVSMSEYLEDVVRRVVDAAFSPGIDVSIRIDDCSMPRQTAVAIGLFANEALTNSAKYAFPDGKSGKVDVRFFGSPEEWTLIIRDNGIGEASTGAAMAASRPGLGSGLMTAFAQQAEADLVADITSEGRTVSLVRRAP